MAVKYQISNVTRRAFTLVETVLMLFALAVFSLATVAVLKKDHFSLKEVLAKLDEATPTPVVTTPASPSPTPSPAPPAKPTGAAAPTTLPAPTPPQPESAKAGSPSPVEKP